MTRLTDKEYWEELYGRDIGTIGTELKLTWRGKLKKILPDFLLHWVKPYDEYLLWDVLLDSTLKSLPQGASVVEIGSAPGDFLVKFSKRFGTVPYGIEYTHSGAMTNRSMFARNGFNPENVIEDDFFSESFIANYGEKFDIVISRGFIEHFDDAQSVVERHIKLLRPGGILLITIPNLRGIYGWWTKHFNAAQMPLHNLQIMEEQKFCSLFNTNSLNAVRCCHIGTFSFWLFTAPPDAYWLNKLIRIFIHAQFVLNLLFRLTLGRHGYESAYFSPNLVYFGKKTK